MINKWNISRNPTTCLNNPRRCNCMKNYPYFDTLLSVLQLQNAKDGLVKGASCLHNVIVDMIDCGINRNPNRQIWMVRPGPGVNDFYCPRMRGRC